MDSDLLTVQDYKVVRTFRKVKISAIKCVLGKEEIDYEQALRNCHVGESRIKRLIKTNGFKSISKVPGNLCVGDLSVIGARELCEELDIEKTSIDAFILVTQNPDYLIPPTSFTIQSKIGLKHECLLFDLISGCPGYINSLLMACCLIESGQCERILLCNGEVTSHDATGLAQPEAALESGDGCTVTLLERVEENSPMHFSVRNFGEMHDVVIQRNYGTHSARVPADSGEYEVDGSRINSFVLDNVCSHIKKFLDIEEIAQTKPTCIVAQQTGKTLLRGMAAVLGFQDNFIPFAAEDFGNISSASIPLSISALHHKGSTLGSSFLAGFGVGLSSALAIVDLKNTKILETTRV